MVGKNADLENEKISYGQTTSIRFRQCDITTTGTHVAWILALADRLSTLPSGGEQSNQSSTGDPLDTF